MRAGWKFAGSRKFWPNEKRHAAFVGRMPQRRAPMTAPIGPHHGESGHAADHLLPQ